MRLERVEAVRTYLVAIASGITAATRSLYLPVFKLNYNACSLSQLEDRELNFHSAGSRTVHDERMYSKRSGLQVRVPAVQQRL
ncbi:hypothetical protein B0H12DRAFT_1107623 [Mycena haematopus]|nr:hypothetical protein B0H12DRAFT_1107623 [Mycena haematopus]